MRLGVISREVTDESGGKSFKDRSVGAPVFVG